MGLKTHGVQKYPNPIRIRHLTFKNTVEVSEATIVDYYFIAGLELFKFLHETITTNPLTNHFNDFIVNWNRLVAKTYETVNTPGEPDLVIQLVELETREDVTREKRLNYLRRPACELVVFLHL